MDWTLVTKPQKYQELLIEHFLTDVLPVTETTSMYKDKKNMEIITNKKTLVSVCNSKLGNKKHT